MYKISILFISAVLFTACAIESMPELSQLHPVNSKADIQPSPNKTGFEECSSLTAEQKDDCLIEIARRDYYYNKIPQLQPTVICAEMAQGSEKANECFWNYAMLSKDQNLCAAVSDRPESPWRTQNSCRAEIHLAGEGFYWNLKSGLPPWADPSTLIYEGEAEVSGWIVYEPFYVGQPIPQFHIEDSELKKLPPSLRDKQHFVIRYLDEDGEVKRVEDINQQPQLSEAKEQSPMKIKISSLVVSMEGSPQLLYVPTP